MKKRTYNILRHIPVVGLIAEFASGTIRYHGGAAFYSGLFREGLEQKEYDEILRTVESYQDSHPDTLLTDDIAEKLVKKARTNYLKASSSPEQENKITAE